MVKDSDKTNLSVKVDGSLYFRNRLCVPPNNELKKKFLYEAHNTVYTMHLGGNKMYQDETVLLVERNEKGCDRVCAQMFDLSASKS